MSPQARILPGLALMLFTLVAILFLAVRLPTTGLDWQVSSVGELQLRLSASDPWQRVEAFRAGREPIPADPALLMEEPDMLPDYASYNRLMHDMDLLSEAARRGTLAVRLADTEHYQPLAVRARHLGELPGMFWYQVAFGISGCLIGLLVWAARPGRETILFALTGLGYLTFTTAAAVYSTRELLIDGYWWRLLSAINHGGALFFTASLTALLWCYPRRLGRVPMVTLSYLSAGLIWLIDQGQWLGTLAGFHLGVLGLFALGILFAVVQWWQSRHHPLDRATIRWFLLSIYLATGLFAGLIIIPSALNLPPPASQGVMFGAFLIMYVGMALGVIRYRLFELERWWFSIWAWLLGGLAVIVLDLLLIALLAVNEAIALTTAVAVVGWLWFPLRQWLWQRMMRRQGRSLVERLGDLLPEIAGLADEAALQNAWPGLLRRVYEPLTLAPHAGALTAPALADNGQTLCVPALGTDTQHYRLAHAGQGERLFTAEDTRHARVLLHLLDLARERLQAREQGARAERDRLRRDVHDDLGARLLTLLHRVPSSEQSLVREALQDMRGLLRAMEGEPRPLSALAEEWHQEALERARAADVPLSWATRLDHPSRWLSPRQQTNLTRILREALSNALRHARPERIRVELRQRGDQLELLVDNDVNAPVSTTPGRGTLIMQARVAELGGELSVSQGERWQLVCRVPLADPGLPGQAGGLLTPECSTT